MWSVPLAARGAPSRLPLAASASTARPGAPATAKRPSEATAASAGGLGPVRKRAAIAVTLEELIAKRRSELRQAREEVPALRARANALRARAASMTARYQRRPRLDVVREAAALDQEAMTREARTPERLFEETASHYLRVARAHAAASTPPDVSTTSLGDADTSRVITVPGVSRETASRFLTSTSLRETRRVGIVHEFRAEVHNVPPKLVVRARDECPFCHQALVLNGVKSVLVCGECGYSVVHLDSTRQCVSYTEEHDFSTISYKRQSHFDDLLKLVQGKESLVMPDEIITAVMRELYAQRVRKEDVTQTKVREVLRKRRLRRAYDHVAQVTTAITGVRTPRISAEMEDRCRKMFVRMQPVFEKHCPRNRKNFLSYHYVLFRCFHVLGLRHMLAGFALLKSREKLLLQDEIFSKIAEELGWRFVPIDDVMREVQKEEHRAPGLLAASSGR